MDKANVIFSFESNKVTIHCLKEDKMKDICQKYANKIQININSLIFLYGGSQINLELSFNEQATLMDRNDGLMKILVYKNENNEYICPKCGEKIKLNTEKINNIILSYNNIKETINGIKFQIDSIINNSLMNSVNIQLKNINLLLNNINEVIQKNNEKLKNLFNNIDNNDLPNKNIIKGILDIKASEINKNIVLFNQDINKNIDVYLNNKKIKIIKDNKTWKYNFKKEGKYNFEIVFNDFINDLERFFDNCIHIISLDLSNFNSSNIINCKCMFAVCANLKKIIGINKLNTNKVQNMKAMFELCKELEYLDLSNFNTENVTDMSYMFDACEKLKEIKGMNKFNTNKVIHMETMFQKCYELDYLDLSNFNTENVTNMSYMFTGCNI